MYDVFNQNDQTEQAQKIFRKGYKQRNTTGQTFFIY